MDDDFDPERKYRETIGMPGAYLVKWVANRISRMFFGEDLDDS